MRASAVAAGGTGGAFVARVGAQVFDSQGQKFGTAVLAGGAGGAFVIWTDTRPGASKVHAQRLDAQGGALWIDDGVPTDTFPPSPATTAT